MTLTLTGLLVLLIIAGICGALGRALSGLSDRLARLWPSFFAYSFVIEARPKPHSFMLLSNAERFYEAPARTI